jgi:methyl-accepting chemotaxis protein
MTEKNRKIYMVDRKYQVRLMLQVVVLVVVATSVSAISTYLLTNREISSAFYLAHRKTWDLKELLLPVITGTSLITFLIVSIISSYITLRETHRIVGPINRLKEALADISEGRITWVGSVRKGDVLKGFDDSINNLADNLSRSMEAVSGSFAEIESALAELEGSGEVSGRQLEDLKLKVQGLGESLEFFKRG